MQICCTSPDTVHAKNMFLSFMINILHSNERVLLAMEAIDHTYFLWEVASLIHQHNIWGPTKYQGQAHYWKIVVLEHDSIIRDKYCKRRNKEQEGLSQVFLFNNKPHSRPNIPEIRCSFVRRNSQIYNQAQFSKDIHN